MALVYGFSANESQEQSTFKDSNSFTIQPVRVRFTFLNVEDIKTTYPTLFEKYGG